MRHTADSQSALAPQGSQLRGMPTLSPLRSVKSCPASTGAQDAEGCGNQALERGRRALHLWVQDIETGANLLCLHKVQHANRIEGFIDFCDPVRPRPDEHAVEISSTEHSWTKAARPIVQNQLAIRKSWADSKHASMRMRVSNPGCLIRYRPRTLLRPCCTNNASMPSFR